MHFLQNRFKATQLDIITGVNKTGIYRVAFAHYKELAKLLVSLDGFDKLDLPYQEKMALRRVTIDVYTLLAVGLIYIIANTVADGDDEDNFAVQLAAYLSTKLYDEVSGTDGLGLITNAWTSASSPLSQIDNYRKNVSNVFLGYDEEIERGEFAGMNKSLVSMIKLTPFNRLGLYANPDPALSNSFIKHKMMFSDDIQKFVSDVVIND